VAVLELISQAVGLTDTVLRFIDKNRDYRLKKKVEDLITEIREEENKLPEHRDDQKIVDLHDILIVKLRLFQQHLLSAQNDQESLQILQPKGD